MAIREQIMDDLKVAMRARDEVARDTLRLLRTELARREGALEPARELEPAEILQVLRHAVKTRRDAMLQFREGGREDLVERAEQEIVLIERYLPKTMDEASARAAITSIVEELGASSRKDMGKVMKAIRARHSDAIDGRLASTIAAELLAG